jgi:hypothetical protein
MTKRRSRQGGRRKLGSTKRSRKYKKPARRYGKRKRGKLRAHRFNWLKDRYGHRAQKYTRGHLHRHYRVPLGDEIPLSYLVRDQHKPGKLGYQVRFALGRRGYYS